MILRPYTIAAALLLLAGSASAVTLPGFDHAIPVAPEKFEVGGGVAGGDDLITGFALGRFGLTRDLDLGLRAGFVSGLGFKDQSGFEVEAGPRFQFITAEDTGFVDAAVIGDVGVVKTEGYFALGLDPLFMASHHFDLDGTRMLYVSMGLGLGLTYVDIDGAGSDLESGFVGAFSSGVDVVEHVRLSLEARLRDEIQRFGLAVTYLY